MDYTAVEYAIKLDQNDNLKGFREEFLISSDQTIYLDGNSLGRLPLRTKTLSNSVIEEQWGVGLIESWNKHWYSKPEELGNKISSIIGACEGEVIVADNTSLNLYKLAYAALALQKGRSEIVSDVLNFPTDLYILQGLIKDLNKGHKLRLADSNDGISINLPELKSIISTKTALLVLSLVCFKSSYMYNMEEITRWAHERGALVLWDLSHAAGAVPVELKKCGADLAVGCTYKYLNGGPGSPAFLYVRKDLQNQLNSPIQGWFGDARPFEFNLEYKPAPGIKKFLTGTPPVISLMSIEPGIDLIIKAGIENIHHKSVRLSEYFISLFKEILKPLGYELGSPDKSTTRGSHVALKHPHAYEICQALINPSTGKIRIIPDFREPDNIRFGFTPLYTGFWEIRTTIMRLKEIVTNGELHQSPIRKKTVT